MATFLRNQGVPLDVIQRLLGHANPRTTQLYTLLSLGSARTEYDRAMASLRVHCSLRLMACTYARACACEGGEATP